MRRALEGTGIPYAVKVHGSALEYTVKPHPERFLAVAREGLDGARTVLVGSRHTAESLWAALADGAGDGQGDPVGTGETDLIARTRLGPPGVDLEVFRPGSPMQRLRGFATSSTGWAASRCPNRARPREMTGMRSAVRPSRPHVPWTASIPSAIA